MTSSSSNNPSTPFKSSLPTPSSLARRTPLTRSITSSTSSPNLDSPDTVYKKQSLAEAIAKNDPAKYRLATFPFKEDAENDGMAATLMAGRLSKSSALGPRRSIVHLRSETPTGRRSSSAIQLSPPSQLHTRASSAVSNFDASSSASSPTSKSHLTSPGRATNESGIARSKSPLITGNRASLGGSNRGYVTPKRHSEVHSRNLVTSAHAPPLPASTPSHMTATVASRARESRRGRELEIGDLVRMESSDLTGVLRHLGPVQFKSGFYAGLELVGDSMGKGKNDGSVQGVQYFACAPGNGVFCPASKVIALSDEPPKEAVARPASAMSTRSARSSDVFERPPSTTPARARSSMLSRPPSATPSRASSRASSRPPSVTPGSRPASAMSTSRPSSRLTSRKSLGPISVQKEDDDLLLERRTKTSAEFAAAAEKRITQGSRAHQLLRVTARDLEKRRLGDANSKPASPEKVARPASPLKETLINVRQSAGGVRTPRTSLASIPPPPFAGVSTPGLPRIRPSVDGIPTPRVAKGRMSMFARSSGLVGNGMPPPSSPSKESQTERSASAQLYGSIGGNEVDPDGTFIGGLPNRNRSLALEEMDLTPRRRPNAVLQNVDKPGPMEQTGRMTPAGDTVVPQSLYDEQNEELQSLRSQIESLEKQNRDLLRAQESRKARLSEVRSNEAVLEQERAKMRAEARERQNEMEEERRLEKEDEIRRRKEIEEREKELKAKLDETTKVLSKLEDEHVKVKQEFESQKRGLEAKVHESEHLVEEMKNSLESQNREAEDGKTKEALEMSVKLKDAEIESLKSSIQRIETDLKQERQELNHQIDELKDAGRETISLYELRVEECEQEKCDLIENMRLLEARAQEAIRTAESKYDDLVARNGSAAVGGATEIDNENLKEQVSHLQDRIGKYEDQIALANLAIEKEKEHSQKRKDKSQETEANLKLEIKRLRSDIDRLAKREKEQREALEEAHEALHVSQAALQRERAELEVLRADVENIESLQGGSVRQGTFKEKKWEAEKARMQAEAEGLHSQLASARAAKKETSEMLEDARKELREKEGELVELKREFKAMEKDRQQLNQKIEERTTTSDADSEAAIRSLRRAVEEKTNEIATLKTTAGLGVPEQVARAKELFDKEMAARDEELRHLGQRLERARQSTRISSQNLVETNGAAAGNERLPSPSAIGWPQATSPWSNKDDRRSSLASNESSSQNRKSYRLSANGGYAASDVSTVSSANQVSGFSYIVRQLTDENVDIKAKHKLLEAQMREQLDQAEKKARTLEITVETLKKQTNVKGETHSLSWSEAQNEMAEKLAECERRLRVNEEKLQTMKDRLEEVEKEKKKEVQTLNKEVAELEALVEARIFHEDELEGEIDRLGRKLEKEKARKSVHPLQDKKDDNITPTVSTLGYPPPFHVPIQETKPLRVGGTADDDSPTAFRAKPLAPAVGGGSRSVSNHGKSTLDVKQGKTMDDEEDDDFCGLCSKNGHSLVDCDKIKLPPNPSKPTSKPTASGETQTEPCDDCGEVGHRFEECPYAAEIF